MRSLISMAVVAAGTLLLTAGCSADSADPPTPAVLPSAEAAASAPGPVGASEIGSSSPTEGVDQPLKVGATHAFTGSGGEQVAVTLLTHKAKDGEYYGIQVRTCNNGAAPFNASTQPWLLSYSGGEELSLDQIVGGSELEPSFAETELAPGKCRKGWITYELSGKPDGAEYHIEGETSARWEW